MVAVVGRKQARTKNFLFSLLKAGKRELASKQTDTTDRYIKQRTKQRRKQRATARTSTSSAHAALAAGGAVPHADILIEYAV